jgi:outer membrane protein assembly factor BamB
LCTYGSTFSSIFNKPNSGKVPPAHAAVGGTLATAGELVFAGSHEGNFFALDTSSGKPLWDFQTGGPIAANPVSFTMAGRQHVAIAADRALLVLGF